MKKKLKSLVLVLSAMLGFTVAVATPAHAETRHIVMMWEDAGNYGFHEGLPVNWVGACNYSGYTKELPSLWKGRVSSFSFVSMATSCNYIKVYNAVNSIYQTKGPVCWEGYISKAKSLPWNNCNDDVWGVNVSRRGYVV